MTKIDISNTILGVFFIVLIGFGSVQAQDATRSVDVEIRGAVWTKNEGFIKDLTSPDFRIFSGKKELEVLSAEQKDDPVSIGILLDMSPSFHDSSKRFEVGLLGLEKFIELGNPKNEYFILGFAQDQKLILPATSNRDSALAAIQQLNVSEFNGNTAVLDAIKRGTDILLNSPNARKVLVVLSDGQENTSKNDFDDLKKITQKSGVRIFQIIPTASNKWWDESFPRLPVLKNFAFAEDLSDESGGVAIFPDNRPDTIQAFEKVAQCLRSQYFIKVQMSAKSTDPEWYKLKWKLSKESKDRFGKVTIFTPKGIYR